MEAVSGMPSFGKIADELEWMKFPGYEDESYPSFAFVWGNPMAGPSGYFMKFDAGMVTKLHAHSSDYYAVIVKGEIKIWEPGENVERVEALGPGSFRFQKGGEAHWEAINPGEECIAYLHHFGPADYMEVD